MGRVAIDPRDLARRIAASADDLGKRGRAPEVLSRPFTLGPPLEEMAGHPDLGAAHRGWVALSEQTGRASGHPRGVRERLAWIAVAVVRRHPEYRQQQQLLEQLTRVVDALSKRCDELDRRLQGLHEQMGEVAGALGEDLTRVVALVASRADAQTPDHG